MIGSLICRGTFVEGEGKDKGEEEIFLLWLPYPFRFSESHHKIHDPNTAFEIRILQSFFRALVVNHRVDSGGQQES